MTTELCRKCNKSRLTSWSSFGISPLAFPADIWCRCKDNKHGASDLTEKLRQRLFTEIKEHTSPRKF